MELCETQILSSSIADFEIWKKIGGKKFEGKKSWGEKFVRKKLFKIQGIRPLGGKNLEIKIFRRQKFGG